MAKKPHHHTAHAPAIPAPVRLSTPDGSLIDFPSLTTAIAYLSRKGAIDRTLI